MASHALVDALRGRAPVYALLDAARDPGVLACLEASDAPFASLYAGRRSRPLAKVAPYLALVSPGGAILDAMSRDGWGRSWGFFVVAAAPLAEVRRHLRRFLTVETEDGAALSFRFYDPRVLRPFLASATDAERRAFFGPITALFVEDRPSPDAAVLCVERGGEAVPAPSAPWDLPRIRDAQLAVLSRALVDDFVDRAAARLAASLRAPADARAVVVDAVARAERAGLVASAEVERYLTLVGALGAGFDDRLPWARRILARAELAPEHRLRRLERWVRRHGREGARA